MHILFVHQNYPAQFGHLADYLSRQHGCRCTFVTEKPACWVGPVELISYQTQGGATKHSHYCSRTFENAIWHSHAVFEALRARPDLQPDLIVGHSGFGSTLFLRQLYECPILNYFEYFYHPRNSDLDFRPDFPPQEIDRLRAQARNAMILLDLDNCDQGYCPTHWQRGLFPPHHRDRLRVLFDGIDTQIWRPLPRSPRRLGDFTFPDHVKIVTYATRGMEAMRGFDIFMRMAKRLADRHPDVIFLIAGQDRVCYGGDERITGMKSFKDWVMSQDRYDPERFIFLGLLAPPLLAQLFSITDLHVYLTVPFVLSWSVFNALACGATVLASDTAPVREVIEPGRTGLLADFFDVDGFTAAAERVLAAPEDHRELGRRGVELVREKYSLEVCLPNLLACYREVAARPRAGASVEA